MARAGLLDALERGLDVADRVESLGPLGIGALIWQGIPQASRERMLGQTCAACGLAVSRCECCAKCGWNPCACPDRFAIDAEGETVEER